MLNYIMHHDILTVSIQKILHKPKNRVNHLLDSCYYSIV